MRHSTTRSRCCAGLSGLLELTAAQFRPIEIYPNPYVLLSHLSRSAVIMSGLHTPLDYGSILL
jgi:hypothetical protein